MKKILALSLTSLFLPLLASASGDRSKLDYVDYCNRGDLLPKLELVHDVKPNGLCHTVRSGETLSGIAKRYYGDGSKWTELRTYRPGLLWDQYPKHGVPQRLTVGTKLVIMTDIEMSNQGNPPGQPRRGGISNGWGVDYESGEIYLASGEGSGTNIYAGGKLYDRVPSPLHIFLVDKTSNSKIYVSGNYQLIVNKVRNPYTGPGADFNLFTFSPDGKRYAVRTNVRQDVPNPGFIVLSNMGNGPEYDFSDSLIWYNNDTLIYRAQNKDRWRVVVNHKDYKVYNFLENLRVENGVVKFDARHDDGSWTKEEFRP